MGEENKGYRIDGSSGEQGNGQFRQPNILVQRGSPPFSAGLQKALDDARKSGNYYIIVCKAESTTADCGITIHSERSNGFHRGNLVRAWQKAGAQILDFTQEMFFSAVQRFTPQIAELVASELKKDTGGPNHATGSIDSENPDTEGSSHASEPGSEQS